MPLSNPNDSPIERTAPTEDQSRTHSPSHYSILNNSTITNNSIVFNLCPIEHHPRNPAPRPPTPTVRRPRKPTFFKRIRNLIRSARRHRRRHSSRQISTPPPLSPALRMQQPAPSPPSPPPPPPPHRPQQLSLAQHTLTNNNNTAAAADSSSTGRQAFEVSRPVPVAIPVPGVVQQQQQQQQQQRHRSPPPPPPPPPMIRSDLSIGVEMVFADAFSSGRRGAVRGRAFLATEVPGEEGVGVVSSLRDVTWDDDVWG